MPSEEHGSAVSYREVIVGAIKHSWAEEGTRGKLLVLAMVLSATWLVLVLATEVINAV